MKKRNKGNIGIEIIVDPESGIILDRDINKAKTVPFIKIKGNAKKKRRPN